MIKTRFAPSPTGFLHVGALRSALYAYLFAKKNGGTFLLRIEDTDRERFVEGAVENMVSALHWSGITIDEGVDMEEGTGLDLSVTNGKIIQKGNNGPYIQSERLEIYKKYIDQLIEQGDAYYCFCTKDRLKEVREYQELNKLPTGYDGHCRDLDVNEAKRRVEAGEEYVVRMKMQKEGITIVEDMVRGKVEFQNQLIDDQVILKADGFPTYHMAVVVDDHEMGITHVIRGEEWLPSTPKHIALYNMLGWELPKFAHLSMLVNEQKQKLSKRHGDVSVEDFKEKGYLPEAMVNFIAFLGWNPGGEKEIFSLSELEKEFDFAKVHKPAAVFNREKLDWYNREYIKGMDTSELLKLCMPFFINAGLLEDVQEKNDTWLMNVIDLEKERASTLMELVDGLSFIFAKKLAYDSELLVWKKSTSEESKERLQLLLEFLQNIEEGDWSKGNLEEVVFSWIKEKGFGNGDILWPMRVSLSGQKNSPGPFEIATVLGKEESLTRIKKAIELI
ncbi:glutamate--tRNA ligase [Candidatus Parcubacteria bacterium]|jgi:nondiscriminating glutamyl-tRNA synthetase|nr:glutamate--tRNA ligase [Candidatus Parcubacteria bacterium]MBT3948519.1 glutamate--tRNA ligase [Candidatus Parcubacteria bacterium]